MTALLENINVVILIGLSLYLLIRFVKKETINEYEPILLGMCWAILYIFVSERRIYQNEAV